MQLFAGMPMELMTMVQGLVILFVAAPALAHVSGEGAVPEKAVAGMSGFMDIVFNVNNLAASIRMATQ